MLASRLVSSSEEWSTRLTIPILVASQTRMGQSASMSDCSWRNEGKLTAPDLDIQRGLDKLLVVD